MCRRIADYLRVVVFGSLVHGLDAYLPHLGVPNPITGSVSAVRVLSDDGRVLLGGVSGPIVGVLVRPGP
jgi:hypothetical protein